MKPKEFAHLGIPKGEAARIAALAVQAMKKEGARSEAVRAAIRSVVADPASFAADRIWGALAKAMEETAIGRAAGDTAYSRGIPAPWRRWGSDIDEESVRQMENACRLPISVAGALLPDAHVGYGLPIGGVLAVENAVIPYAVGMDIACRMKMTILDIPVSVIRSQEGRLCKAIASVTSFGVGSGFKKRKDHPVMDEDWACSPVTRKNKDKAWFQLGSSGSGNHFVEFGALTLAREDLGIPAGVYLAMLSHSGSRGVGGQVATYYSRLAMEKHKELPRELRTLAWLEVASHAGQEYWQAMHLMGRYASANHGLIHRDMVRALGAEALAVIENHHNFAWREHHFGKEVIVHRKGATPADSGALGIIPGSMATPAYIVRGKGCAESLKSASHGAGRRMSRTMTKNSFTWSATKRFLAERDVVLISAGLDESPMAYKDINAVMAAQQDLVEIVARFDPKLVKMAPGGDRPED